MRHSAARTAGLSLALILVAVVFVGSRGSLLQAQAPPHLPRASIGPSCPMLWASIWECRLSRPRP
jgi:hypothetical protein